MDTKKDKNEEVIDSYLIKIGVAYVIVVCLLQFIVMLI